MRYWMFSMIDGTTTTFDVRIQFLDGEIGEQTSFFRQPLKKADTQSHFLGFDTRDDGRQLFVVADKRKMLRLQILV